jgi:hypothetical protein
MLAWLKDSHDVSRGVFGVVVMWRAVMLSRAVKLARRVILPGDVMLSAVIMSLAAIMYSVTIILLRDVMFVKVRVTLARRGSGSISNNLLVMERVDGRKRDSGIFCTNKVNHNKLWYSVSQADLAVWFFITGSALFVVDDSGYRAR